MTLRPPHLSRKWMIFSVTANGTFMSTLSGGIVNIALPTMSAEFGVSLESIQLVVSFYLLVLTCLLPVFGKLSDNYSRKWMYLGGFIIFGVGALLGALSHSLPTMLLARGVQGIGSSAMMATSQALIAQIFHGPSRGKAFGAIGAVVACGSLAGPAIGGALIQAFGWKSVFWICIPIAIIGVWRGIYLIPRFNARKRTQMDWPGATLYTATSFIFLMALNMGADRGWTSPFILLSFAVSLALFLVFMRRSTTAKNPFFEIALFRNKTILYGCIVAMLGYTALFTNSVLLPFYLTDIMGLDPVKIGLLIMPFPVMLAVASAVSGTLNAKWPARVLTTAGFVLILISTLLFAFIGSSPSISYIVLAQLIMGTGSGTFQVPNNNTVVSAAPKGKLGLVASTNALCRNVGMILGIALSVSIFALVQGFSAAHGAQTHAAFIHGYSAALLFGAVCSVAGGILSSLR